MVLRTLIEFITLFLSCFYINYEEQVHLLSQNYRHRDVRMLSFVFPYLILINLYFNQLFSINVGDPEACPCYQ